MVLPHPVSDWRGTERAAAAPSVPTPDTARLAVSVVVPVRDARARLPTLLAALEHQSLASGEFEIIFVDDGSMDGTVAWLVRNMPANGRLLFGPEGGGGPYAARNVGIRASRGPVVAFTDADCAPDRTWLEDGLRSLRVGGRVAGRIVVETSPRGTLAETIDGVRFLRQDRYVAESFGATANLFVSRRLFEAVGLFDERLVSGGDHEFGSRARAAGVPIRYAPGAVVRHSARSRFRDLWAKAHRVGIGFGQCVRHHSLAHAGARERVSHRLTSIVDGDGRSGRTAWVLGAGQTVLAVGTVLGCVRGYLGAVRGSPSIDR